MAQLGVSHPYFPCDAIIPNYEANTTPLVHILGEFLGLIVTFIASGLYIGKRINPSLGRGELTAPAWFLLCFFLHAFFEGYFVRYHSSLAGSQSLFAQLWKEYALSDSRYMTSDPFMLCIESFTVVVWAPLCFAIVVANIHRHKLRHALQIIMCVGHLYGVALYYGTCYFEFHYRGISHSRPEVLYYWVYYLGLNAAWVVVPAVYLLQSIRCVYSSMELRDKMSPKKPTAAVGFSIEEAGKTKAELEETTRVLEANVRALKDKTRVLEEQTRLMDEVTRRVAEQRLKEDMPFQTEREVTGQVATLPMSEHR